MPTKIDTGTAQEGHAVPQALRLRLLADLQPFADLDPASLFQLALALQVEEHAAGFPVVTEGQEGNCLYIIVQGKAEVSVISPADPLIVATLTDGEMFGEMALLSSTRQRQASVTALTPLLTLTLADAAFTKLLSSHPGLKSALEVAAESHVIVNFLKQSSPFTRWSAAQLRWLSTKLERLSVPAGATIIEQGEQGDTCYLLRSGQVAVVVKEATTTEKRLATLGAGALFGEMALLSLGPRTATVRSLEPCELLALRRDDLLATIQADRKVGMQLLELQQLRARPRQLPGIIVQHRTTLDGEAITILKNPQRYTYYRLSATGWFIWQRLDGQHTLRDLFIAYLTTYRSFAPAAIAALLQELAAASFIESKALSADVMSSLSSLPWWQRLPPLARALLEWRITLHNVDRPLERLYHGIRWLYTRPAQYLLSLLTLCGLLVFALDSLRIGPIFSAIGDRRLLLLLIPAYLLMILLHETGHACTVKHFGYEVPGVGIGWYCFLPIAFVDTSDMWQAGRWPRIAVSLAGPYTNLLLASTAAMATLLTSYAPAIALLWSFASLSYLIAIINFNPFLDLDGYYILMDWFERPGLRKHCLTWLIYELPHAIHDRNKLKEHRLELCYCLGSLLFCLFALFTLAFLIRSMLQ